MRKFAILLSLLALFAMQSAAITTYIHTISSCTTYESFYAATHGIPSPYAIGVQVKDGSGNILEYGNAWSLSYNEGGTVNVTLSPSLCSGTIRLVGNYNTTSNDRDFKVTRHLDGNNLYRVLKICDGCTGDNYARRTWSSKSYVANNVSTITFGSSPNGDPYTLTVYLKDGRLKAEICNGCTATVNGPIQLVYGQNYAPAGSVSLGQTQFNGSEYGSVTDTRP